MTEECEGHRGGNRLTWQNPFSISTLELRLIFHPLHKQEGSSQHSPRLGELLHTILSISFREQSQTQALDTVHSPHLRCITPISQGNSWWWGHQGEQGQLLCPSGLSTRVQLPVEQPCPMRGGSLVAGEAVSLHTLPGKRAGILVRGVAIAMGKVSEAKSILMDSADYFGDHHLRSDCPDQVQQSGTI